MGASRPRDRKAQIARAAEHLFHEFGYHGVGVDTVAAEVGIGGSALYRHYRSKQELLAGVVFDGLAQFSGALDKATATSRSVDELLAALAPAALDQRGVPVLWQREVRHMRAADQIDVRERTQALEDRIADALSICEPTDSSVRLRARAVLSVLWSPSYHHSSPRRAEFEELLAGLASAAWRVELPGSVVSAGARKRIVGRVHASHREKILAAANELFAARGFAEVSVDDIGAVLDVTGASVYRYFSTKAEILHTSLWRGAEALHLSLSQALADADDSQQALEQVLISYVDVMVQHRGFTQLLVTEVMNLPEEARPDIRRTQREYVGEWVHLLRESSPGLTEEGARVVVHAALTVINDLFRTEPLDGGALLREDAVALGLAILRPGPSHR